MHHDRPYYLEPGPYEYLPQVIHSPTPAPPPKPAPKAYFLHIILFILTLLTTTLAGAELITNKSFVEAIWYGDIEFGWREFAKGFGYSIPFLFFITAHEFGHYFTAMYYRVKCSLPYYIPVFIPLPFLLNIGSFGAVIRLRQIPDSAKKYFDIGVAGPLAGFVVSLLILWYGFATLPPLSYLYDMNPDYLMKYGGVPTEAQIIADNSFQVRVGNSLIFSFFEYFVADPDRLPNHFEIIHYPLLFVGFLTLFFTALNLLPIGQYDGGHVVYGLLGQKRALLISKITVLILITYGGLGLTAMFGNWSLTLSFYLLYLFYLVPKIVGRDNLWLSFWVIIGIVSLQQLLQVLFDVRDANFIWLLYAFISIRISGLEHPKAEIEEKLDFKRKIIGWIAIVIFVLCFTPSPIIAPSPNNSSEIKTFTAR